MHEIIFLYLVAQIEGDRVPMCSYKDEQKLKETPYQEIGTRNMSSI